MQDTNDKFSRERFLKRMRNLGNEELKKSDSVESLNNRLG